MNALAPALVWALAASGMTGGVGVAGPEVGVGVGLGVPVVAGGVGGGVGAAGSAGPVQPVRVSRPSVISPRVMAGMCRTRRVCPMCVSSPESYRDGSGGGGWLGEVQ